MPKKKLLIIGPSKRAPTTDLIIEEAKEFFKTDFVPINDIIVTVENGKFKITGKNKDFSKYDYVLPKIDSRRVEYGYPIMKALDSINISKPYSAEVVLIAHDKFLTTQLLNKHGLPVPKTYLAKSKSAVDILIPKIKFPAIIKLTAGYGGQGIMFVENAESMKSIMASMEMLKQRVLIQEFVKNPGEDIRILVLGDEVAGAYKRIAKEGEIRANIKMGGKAVSFTPSEELKEIAIKASKVLKADICAVDILESTEGPKIVELNINPGIRGMMEATNLNIAKKIIGFIKRKLENE